MSPSLLLPFQGQLPSQSTYKTLSPPFFPPHSVYSSLNLRSLSTHFISCVQELVCSIAVQKWIPFSIEKIRAMRKYRRSRRQRQQQLPNLTLYMAATCVLCLLLTSPAWFPSLCSLLSSFFLTTLPDLATAFLLSPKCLFVVGNLIVAFLINESRQAPPRSQPSSLLDVNGIHEDILEEHMKRSVASVTAATTVVFPDHSTLVGGVWEGEKEERGEEELEKRVEDFIARVKRQRKLEAKSFFDTDR